MAVRVVALGRDDAQRDSRNSDAWPSGQTRKSELWRPTGCAPRARRRGPVRAGTWVLGPPVSMARPANAIKVTDEQMSTVQLAGEDFHPESNTASSRH